MSSLLQDLRFALRMLSRTPGFTFVAIAVLALGIGVNTAIFSVVHELVWSPRPYPDPERVVQLYSRDRTQTHAYRIFSYPTYRDIAANNTVFEGVLAHHMAMIGVGEGETSRRTFGAIVSSNYFSVLGVTLRQGRSFLPEEEVPGSDAAVAIASDVFWKKTGYDPGLVGRTIRVNERLVTVVGIAPPHFTGTMMLFGPELYFPLGASAWLENQFEGMPQRTLDQRDAQKLFLVGRLKADVTPEAANAALDTIASQLEGAYPVEQKGQTFHVGVLPRLSTNSNPTEESDLAVLGSLLLGMAGIVLLIACLNLANLLLARGNARRKEIAVRLALGGSRSRIVRQLLTEGAVLALAGGTAGFMLAMWSSGLLSHSLSALMPVTLFLRGAANPALLAAALGLCALATVGFALGPALKLSRAAVIGDLKEQAGEDPARRRWRWMPRHLLIVAQLALSLTLLSVAGLFIRAAFKASGVSTGFETSRTVLAEVDASLAGYSEAQALEMYRSINDRLSALPGVQASAVGSVVPFGMITLSHSVRRAGLALDADSRPATAEEGMAFDARWSSVGAAYFQAMGLPLLRGRAFTAAEAEHAGAPRVAIIDEVLARRLFGEVDPLGQRIQIVVRDAPASADRDMEVVGIVPATRWDLSEGEVGSALYVPFAQGYQSNAFFHVRLASLPKEGERVWLDAIRREVRGTAPRVPLFGVKTFQQHLDASGQLWMARAGGTLFGIFGALALVLAVIGIYGVKAYAVARRTREIGIRLALGATVVTVQRMILREGLGMTLCGLAVGLALSLVAGQACASMLYDVSAFDPLAYGSAAVVLGLAALAACWLPARRATRVSPMAALRTE